jgi:tripartite-type tricarboxylate transporter receptor subunit TctC
MCDHVPCACTYTARAKGRALVSRPAISQGGTVKKWIAAIASILIVAGVAAQPAPAGFQPTRPVTLIVPYASGGGTDSIGRLFAKELAELWSQPVVIDNRVGASGIIGATAVAKAAPDGQTLLLAFASLVINP